MLFPSLMSSSVRNCCCIVKHIEFKLLNNWFNILHCHSVLILLTHQHHVLVHPLKKQLLLSCDKRRYSVYCGKWIYVYPCMYFHVHMYICMHSTSQKDSQVWWSVWTEYFVNAHLQITLWHHFKPMYKLHDDILHKQVIVCGSWTASQVSSLI